MTMKRTNHNNSGSVFLFSFLTKDKNSIYDNTVSWITKNSHLAKTYMKPDISSMKPTFYLIIMRSVVTSYSVTQQLL